MTTQDQDAEVGRLVRERRDLRAHHEVLVSKAQSMGRLLSAMEKALTVRPPGRPYPEHTIVIETDGSVRVSDEYHAQEIITAKFPPAVELHELLSEQKHAQRRLSELDAQLKAFGV